MYKIGHKIHENMTKGGDACTEYVVKKFLIYRIRHQEEVDVQKGSPDVHGGKISPK